MSLCIRTFYGLVRTLNDKFNVVEKFLLATLLVCFIFPLTLPNTYSFGYRKIDPPKFPECPFRDDIQLNNVDGHFSPSDNRIFSELEYGGKYKNDHCKSSDKQRIAIIVPFRNRSEHLKIFLEHMHSFLIKQNQIDYQIYVVEQADNKLFNRANLLNIGYKEALLLDPHIDCFIFHDVDILPLNLEQTYSCTDLPKHLCSYLDKFRYTLLYPELFGGVITIRTDQFARTNGYSNLFSGWGGEDDDFYQRVHHHFGSIERYSPNVARCIMIKHGKDKVNNQREALLNDVVARSGHDGLSTLNQTYNLESIEHFQFYIKIKVTLVSR